MARAMAQLPAVLEGYLAFSAVLSKGSLGKRLGEELALTLAAANHCDYCASAHAVLGKLAGLSEAQTIATLRGNSDQARQAATLRLAETVVEKRNRIADADFKAVTDAGFTPGEIVARVALNTFTHYLNNVANTEIDFPRVDLTKVG